MLNTIYLKTLQLFLSLLILSLAACGPKAFQGRLTPAPEWAFSSLQQWDYKYFVKTGEFAIHGHGTSKNQNLISKRRALADANATQDVKQRFIEAYAQSLAGAAHRQAFIKIVSELSWEQIALNSERFFDAEKNQQHTLVSVSQSRVLDALNFERSMNNQGNINWDQVFRSIKTMYQGLSTRNPQ